ncbi:MAG: polyphosphate kinase 2 family protein [Chlorobiaceae bacterium]|nr:polyphosphate kinase 2 family protein [Chlorobiaceae bacterium]
MKFDLGEFSYDGSGKVHLATRPTRIRPVYASKSEYKEMLAEHVRQLSAIQNILYADNRYALLIIFQALDAAGKDSVIKHVMSGVNPQGCQVYSFKHPSPRELEHDFLWRTSFGLPERGHIGIFNRSYYEEVLIVRVHPEILASQNIPDELTGHGKVWEHRYRSIVDQERHLHCNGTRILKFYLHLSKEEQRLRFLDRIDNPEKNWKFSVADVEERQYWDQYLEAYEACIEATGTRDAPWYIIPADDKKTTRLIVSSIIVETLKSLKLSYPETSLERRKELLTIRKRLENPENGQG